MYHNYVFNDVNEALPNLLTVLMDSGAESGSRNGAVKELTHVGITLLTPTQREILLPERKANIAAQIAETAWVLRGRNDLEFLNHYLPRAIDYSDDGTTWRGGYGPRLRRWENPNLDKTGMTGMQIAEARYIDQIQHVVDTLRKDPMSRQAVATIYDPGVDVQPGKDIPCNNWLTFTSRLGKLDLHVGIRSNDVMWGWSGINAFEWSVLQEVVAGMLGINVGALHFSTTNLHLYAPHWAKAERIIDMYPNPMVQPEVETPRFNATGIDDTTALDAMLDQWFEVEEQIRTGSFTAAQESIDAFPEPMFQSWLRVLHWWWTGDHSVMAPLGSSALELATHVAVQPPPRTSIDQQIDALHGPGAAAALDGAIADGSVFGDTQQSSIGSQFVRYVVALHNEKHDAYGDSWKRRGEMLGIMANIARKIDRLVGGETRDETSADTAVDLLVYLAKYRAWLDEDTDTTDAANAWISNTAHRIAEDGQPVDSREKEEDWLRRSFDLLEKRVVAGSSRAGLVSDMLAASFVLALQRWKSDPTRTEDGQYRGADVD